MGPDSIFPVLALLAHSVRPETNHVFSASAGAGPSTGFPDTLDLVQYKELQVSDNDIAARITFGNLRNFENKDETQVEVIFPNKPEDVYVVRPESQKKKTATEMKEEDITEYPEVTMPRGIMIGRDEKSLIGTFPFDQVRDKMHGNDLGSQHGNHRGNHHGNHHENHQHNQPENQHGNQPDFQRNEGEVYGEHQAFSNSLDLQGQRKFELIHGLAQQGATEEVIDGRRCVNKVRKRQTSVLHCSR